MITKEKEKLALALISQKKNICTNRGKRKRLIVPESDFHDTDGG
jgi:hypothetical protein